MNYGRRGASQALRAYLPLITFLNARLQGLSRLAEGAVGPKGERSSRKRALAQMAVNGALLTFFGLAVHAWNRGQFGDDEERRRKYDAEPLERRLNYHIIYVGDKKILIPKAFEVGALFNSLPEMLYNAVTEGETGELGPAALKTIMNTLSFNPIPTGALPAVEVAANYDFFTGQPIEGMRDEAMVPSDRFSQYTGALAVLLGRQLGLSDMTGLSPAKIDHLASGYGGLAYVALNAAVDVVAKETGLLPEKPAGAFGDVPVISSVAQNILGSMFKDADPDASNKFLGLFYDLKDEATQIHRSAKEAADLGNVERAKEIASRMPAGEAIYTKVNGVGTVLSRINRQIRHITADPNLTAGQKRERLRPLVRDRNQLSAFAYQNLTRLQTLAEQPPGPERERAAQQLLDGMEAVIRRSREKYPSTS